jgi:hypothetical protein
LPAPAAQVFRNEEPQRLTDELGRRETETVDDVPVHEHDALEPIDDDDGIGRRGAASPRSSKRFYSAAKR